MDELDVVLEDDSKSCSTTQIEEECPSLNLKRNLEESQDIGAQGKLDLDEHEYSEINDGFETKANDSLNADVERNEEGFEADVDLSANLGHDGKAEFGGDLDENLGDESYNSSDMSNNIKLDLAVNISDRANRHDGVESSINVRLDIRNEMSFHVGKDIGVHANVQVTLQLSLEVHQCFNYGGTVTYTNSKIVGLASGRRSAGQKPKGEDEHQESGKTAEGNHVVMSVGEERTTRGRLMISTVVPNRCFIAIVKPVPSPDEGRERCVSKGFLG